MYNQQIEIIFINFIYKTQSLQHKIIFCQIIQLNHQQKCNKATNRIKNFTTSHFEI